MSTDLVARNFDDDSPFDRIRHTRGDGSEYWTARELCNELNYETWRNFAAAVDRAMIAADNSGHPAQDHFVDVSKMIDLGKGGRRQIEDRELSRYGAYLVVMNGDPRKPEIAAGQTYFAVRTHEAETRPALPDITTAAGLLALTEMFRDTAKQLVAVETEKKVLEAAIERDAPLVAKAEAHTVSDSAIHRQEFGREVKTWGRKQDIEILQDHVMRFLGHIGLFIRGERSDTGHATSEAIRRGLAFTEKGTSKKNGHAYAVGKLTPAGQDYAWKRITKYVAEHGDLELPRELHGGESA